MTPNEFRFCFTLDTEPDDLWKRQGSITFDHFRLLPDFHRRMVDAGARPTYLTTSEVVENSDGLKAMQECVRLGSCEIGAHIHTWTRDWPFEMPDLGTPRAHAMAHRCGQQAEEQMLTYTCNALKSHLGIAPRSHRGGRWSINRDTFRSLANCGLNVDSTFVPGVSWRRPNIPLEDGADFRRASREPVHYDPTGNGAATETTAEADIVEIPVGSASLPGWARKAIAGQTGRRVAGAIRRRTPFRVGVYALRPAVTSLADMTAVMHDLRRSNVPVWVIVIHSSEIVPCTKIPTAEGVREFIERCESVVRVAAELGAAPATLAEAADWVAESGRTRRVSDAEIEAAVQ